MLLAAAPELRVHTDPPAASLDAMAEDTLSDHEIMIAVRGGEVVRLGELFERHHHRLYGFFVRLTSQPSLSEDLVQMVFYRILKYRHTYRDEGKFSAWMYHLARKVAADHFRKSATVPIATDPAELPELADSAPDSAERAAGSDDLALLQVALDRLPVEQRELLVLSRLQNVEHRDIARLLDSTPGAIKVRVHRALKELREVYFRLRRERPA
jgi:RNA polymerase sigma-70 factor (ECF subfamily)